MLLLLATALAADDHGGHDHGAHGHESEECSCAQHEPDHPFTIDCDNPAPIRAATITLETTCESEVPGGYEWGGVFETPADAYTWVAQAVDGEYADPEMNMVVFSVEEADDEHLLEMAFTAKTLLEGSCTAVSTTDTIPAPTADGACYTLTFPTDATTDFHATLTTTGVAHVAFFTAHMPTEFERDTHYLMDAGMSAEDMAVATGGATVASGGPVEPAAETDPKEYNCKIDADATGLKVCHQAFLIIQAHHDYCPHDTLTRYEEELFHEWEHADAGARTLD